MKTVAIFVFLTSAFAFAAEPNGQVIGFYSAGRMSEGTPLPSAGKGFIHLFPARNHYFGSEGMIGLLENLAGSFHEDHLDGERLQIADIAAEHGGPVGQHASHQNGLDADLVYFRKNHYEQQPTESDDFVEQFVVDGKLSSNFDLVRNYQFIRRLAGTGRLTRIFVDPVIKRSLCEWSAGLDEDPKDRLPSRAETLRRLRPYPNHANHMHVRINCPATSPHCIPQQEVPPGDGCDHITVDLRELAD